MKFEDIYRQWTASHDEDGAISRYLEKNADSDSSSSTDSRHVPINAIRRMNAQAELDLHGVKFEDATATAVSFIESAFSKGLSKIRIITGKGLHSPGGRSIIRPEIISAVRSHPAVREVNLNPKAKDGGSGAIILILKTAEQV